MTSVATTTRGRKWAWPRYERRMQSLTFVVPGTRGLWSTTMNLKFTRLVWLEEGERITYIMTVVGSTTACGFLNIWRVMAKTIT